jgi:hypothetical protein
MADMTKDEIQEEAGILDLACAQLGRELIEGRLRSAADVSRRLEVIIRKLKRLELEAQPAASDEPKPT